MSAGLDELREQIQVANALLQRSLTAGAAFGVSGDGKRDYNQIFAYGKDLSFADFHGIYKRGGIARVIVAKVARACWRDTPVLKVGESAVLENEILELKKLGLFTALERADILNRIGKYAALMIGVPDGQELIQPVANASGLEGFYFMPFAEPGVTMQNWDQDPTSERYGLPAAYQLQTTENHDDKSARALNVQRVHWQRVVMLAEGALENPLIGASALECIYNAIQDKEKVRGGAAEAYYRNARTRYAMKLQENAGGALSDAEKSALRDEVEAFNNGWQSYMRLKNMDIQEFTPAMASPKDAWDAIIQEIAGATEIPVRVLTGVGGGQLAGAEDRASWNALVADRQQSFCTGVLMSVLAVLDRAGAIQLPENVAVEWPVSPVLNETEATDANYKKAQTLAQITSAKTSVGGDEVNLESALAAVGLGEITLDTLPDVDDVVE